MGATKKIVVVCEDSQQNSFVSECLRELGCKTLKRDLYSWIAGRELSGGNVDSVIRRVSDVEFPAWQRRCPHCKALLVVVADADTHDIAERVADFPSPGHSMFSRLYVVVVPKRNIETWVRLSQGQGVDETTDYKNRGTTTPGVARTAAKQLMKWFGNPSALPAQLVGNSAWATFQHSMGPLQVGLQAVSR